MAPCTEMGKLTNKAAKGLPKEEVVAECEVICIILKVVPFLPHGGTFLD